MNYFIHIVTDFERLIDHEGYCFASASEARDEAEMAARQILAEELLAVRPLPLSWRAEVTDQSGKMISCIEFSSLVREDPEREPQNRSADSKRIVQRLKEASIAGGTGLDGFARKLG